ncbi:MAG: NtrZ family periplasmic regulatory protein [Caulobacteraceae bacterium]
MSGMSVRSLVRVAAAAAVLAAWSGVAHAADAKDAKAGTKPLDFTVHMDTVGASTQAPSVKWDAERKKWGFTLNLQQPDTRASTWNDIQAGAYYRITPSLRVGGAFAFGDQQPLPGPKPGVPEAGQPRVQLETKFKF